MSNKMISLDFVNLDFFLKKGDGMVMMTNNACIMTMSLVLVLTYLTYTAA